MTTDFYFTSNMTYATTASTWIDWNSIWYSTAATDSTCSSTVIWANWNTEWVTLAAPLISAVNAEIEQRFNEQVRRTREATTRARQLLREFLDQKQLDTYEKHKWFEVVTPKGRRFRIMQGSAGNVYLMDGGAQQIRYCIHPVEWVPEEDAMLAQKLMLEHEEDEFERVANKTRLAA